MKCKELMVGDFCRSGHGLPMQITNVGDDYAYATFEGNEGDPWEFDDKNYKPCGIPLTREILKKNGFEVDNPIWKTRYGVRCSYNKKVEDNILIHFIDIDEFEESGLFEFGIDHCLWQGVTIKYVHELQRALRCCGLWNLANNFKI